MDPLSPFFDRFALSARVFYSGRLCGTSGPHDSQTFGHLHVLRRGALKITQPNGRTLKISEPSVLFYPRPRPHRFHTDEKRGAELVCAQIEFGTGMLNPLVTALPELMIVPLAEVKELDATVQLLFAEAFGNRAGRQTAVDRLAEYFLVLLLRTAIQSNLVESGALAGLADPRLSKAIRWLHAQPERAFTLEQLARAAGMSRARFALHFRKTVGVTPFDYLSSWRVGLAQTLLRQRRPLKIVAPAVGYSGSPALTRAFYQHVGMSPTEWLKQQRETVPRAD